MSDKEFTDFKRSATTGIGERITYDMWKCFKLRLEGYTQREAAKELGIPKTTLVSRVDRVKALIKGELKILAMESIINDLILIEDILEQLRGKISSCDYKAIDRIFVAIEKKTKLLNYEALHNSDIDDETKEALGTIFNVLEGMRDDLLDKDRQEEDTPSK